MLSKMLSHLPEKKMSTKKKKKSYELKRSHMRLEKKSQGESAREIMTFHIDAGFTYI